LLSKTDLIDRGDLPADLAEENTASGATLEDIERDYILKVLRESGGQRGKAASVLGISSKTLYRKLLSYGIKE